MRCPTLLELPLPPAGKTGWPWTEESLQLPDTISDDSPWPRVGIVTPSYNQAQFVEETIRSVLLQGYPNLEYIVIDGGSTDGSIEIVRKYERWLSHWVSEPDCGQSHAINKGFRRAKGDIVSWLNSDDYLLPGSVWNAVSIFMAEPGCDLVHGDVVVKDEDCDEGDYVRTSSDLFSVVNWINGVGLAQPATFWRKGLFDQVGFLDESLRFNMDYEFFLRSLRSHRACHAESAFAIFRLHPASKTSTMNLVRVQEHMDIARRNWSWLEQYAAHDYWSQVRRYCAQSLLAQYATGENGRWTYKERMTMLIRAVVLSPRLLKEDWVMKLLIKTLLGEKAANVARRNLSKLFPRQP